MTPAAEPASRPAARSPADGSAAPRQASRPAPFVVTKEHRRFAEFADAVRRDRYIGLCYGPPGRRQDPVRPALRRMGHRRPLPAGIQAPGVRARARQALAARAIVYTPTVANTPRTVDKGVTFFHDRLSWGIGLTQYPGEDLDALTGIGEANGPFAELLIVDEADRLKTPALEHLRDHHDRTGIGLILIGMPGIEKRLARYPQLYSRVGFVHHYRPLSAQEQAFVLARHWPELGLGDTSDFTTSEAVAAITRITSGNFRLTCRLVAQIQRVLDINHLSVVTREVVEAARESLVIGVM